MEENAEIFGWTPIQKLLIAKRSLTDWAAMWYRAEEPYKTWEKLRDALRVTFPDAMDSKAVHEMMTDRKKMPNESYIEYMLVMKELAKRGNLSDKVAIEYIVEGIEDSNEMNKIMLYGVKSYDDFEDKLKAYEHFKMKLNQQKWQRGYPRKARCSNVEEKEHRSKSQLVNGEQISSQSSMMTADQKAKITTQVTNGNEEQRHTQIVITMLDGSSANHVDKEVDSDSKMTTDCQEHSECHQDDALVVNKEICYEKLVEEVPLIEIATDLIDFRNEENIISVKLNKETEVCEKALKEEILTILNKFTTALVDTKESVTKVGADLNTKKENVYSKIEKVKKFKVSDTRRKRIKLVRRRKGRKVKIKREEVPNDGGKPNNDGKPIDDVLVTKQPKRLGVKEQSEVNEQMNEWLKEGCCFDEIFCAIFIRSYFMLLSFQCKDLVDVMFYCVCSV